MFTLERSQTFARDEKPSLTEMHSTEFDGDAIEWASTIIKLYDQDDLISNDHRSGPR
jgi:hypothetical protein